MEAPDGPVHADGGGPLAVDLEAAEVDPRYPELIALARGLGTRPSELFAHARTPTDRQLPAATPSSEARVTVNHHSQFIRSYPQLIPFVGRQACPSRILFAEDRLSRRPRPRLRVRAQGATDNEHRHILDRRKRPVPCVAQRTDTASLVQLPESGPLTMPRRLLDSMTYANVVATFALFVSLGGASYAAITLPANSVGAKQLRAGAVHLGALSFPLGTIGIVDDKVEDLIRTHCNGGLENTGNAVPPCPASGRGGPTPGREVHVLLHSAGRLMVSGVVGLRNEGVPQSSARITLGLNVDQRPVAESQITSVGGQSVEVPIQALAAVSAGSHSAGFEVEVEYDSHGSGDVLVTGVSLIASALPGNAEGK